MTEDSRNFKSFPCSYPKCNQVFRSASGRTQHLNAVHREITPASEPDPSMEITTQYHPILNGRPCDKNGCYLLPFTKPAPVETIDATANNMWAPFNDRLAFDFADFHFTELQSSRSQINRALDLWRAAVVKSGGDDNLPWSNVDELYATIDAIQEGDAPWKTIPFKYTGPLPNNPPKWMLETYELCTRDSRILLHQQLATTEFVDEINYIPYRQFKANGDRIWSNLLSADWSWSQADMISLDKANHSAMFVPVCSGSDKTTTTVGTGQQEYHPVYQSPGNITNVARRAHGNSVLPVAFLPIPKTSKRHRQSVAFQRFSRQLYHACLARIFMPLKSGMITPEVVRCPDGHFRRAIYGLGPYIADYPEQVWLAGIVQNWCPKCDAPPNNLDRPGSHRRTHEKTDFLISCFHPDIVWSEFGIRSDVVPFTHGFPRADIHELLSPDLLHQLIKGTFKDHYVTWVCEYLCVKHGEARALEIIQDIDRRISAVPIYPGLRRFPDGRGFSQWTGDDSKALMKVYLAAISGHVPPKMVQCISALMELCYLFRRNAITSVDLDRIKYELERLQELRTVFVEAGIRTDISLPRQHSLLHYIHSIMLFGSPNGLCSSITESKHIVAVKEPWRRSSHYKALSQMLCTINRLEKLASLRRIFMQKGMLAGTTSAYVAEALHHVESKAPNDMLTDDEITHDNNDMNDVASANGPRTLSSVKLSSQIQQTYPKTLENLAVYIGQPHFPGAFHKFLHSRRHPNTRTEAEGKHYFTGKIHVFHSAVARFYAPSDLCGVGGMHREHIRSAPTWRSNSARRDTVFVSLDESRPGMEGMHVARVLLFFSFYDSYFDEDVPCALVNWFIPDGTEPDEATGMWKVVPEYQGNTRSLDIVHLDSIARGAHLLPIYGTGFLPEDFHYTASLDAFRAYFVNHYIDHHAHEFLTS